MAMHKNNKPTIANAWLAPPGKKRNAWVAFKKHPAALCHLSQKKVVVKIEAE